MWRVPAGNQAVSITATGYANYSNTTVITSGNNTGVNFTMTADSISGTVLASQGGNVGQEQS